MILLDTTVLVYAVGKTHPLRDQTRQLMELVRDGAVSATTSIEVIQEFAHVRARRRPKTDAVTWARAYATGLSPLISLEEEDLFEGLELFRVSDALGAFDAVLAAMARRRGLVLASGDQSFGEVDGLEVLDPSSPTFLDDALRIG